MSRLRQRLSDPQRSGVYAIAHTADVQDCLQGHSHALIDVVCPADTQDQTQWMQAFARALAFPDGVSPNWDAFEESLRDLSWCTPNATRILICEAPAPSLVTNTLLDVLRAVAAYWQAQGLGFFVLFIDPHKTLGLPALYRERGTTVHYKLPVSVLVVIHTPQLDILLLERVTRPGYWQSVTGSLDALDEPLPAAACREVHEETGQQIEAAQLRAWPVVNQFEIFTQWRHRYAPGTTHNTEHMFSLEVPQSFVPVLSPTEHCAYRWMPWAAAAQACFSWTNRDAIYLLAQAHGQTVPAAARGPSPSQI